MVCREKTCGFIYFLLSEKMDAVKIGFTRGNIYERIKDSSTWHPYSLDLLKMIKGTMIEERDLHKRFVKYKVKGEWFMYSDELKAYIESL